MENHDKNNDDKAEMNELKSRKGSKTQYLLKFSRKKQMHKRVRAFLLEISGRSQSSSTSYKTYTLLIDFSLLFCHSKAETS
jgi:hypothetical protein